MKKKSFLIVLSVIFLSSYACKNSKEQTKNEDQQNKETKEISKTGKIQFTNLTEEYGYVSKYEENVEFSIDSVLMKTVDTEKYGLRVYISGNYDKYDGPSFPFYLHLFPVKEETALLPEERLKYRYDNISFPFKVVNDESGKPYVYKEFETILSSAKLMKLIVTNKGTNNSKIIEIHYKDVPFY